MHKPSARGALAQAAVSTVFLYVHDYGKMLAFYRDTLGLAVLHEGGEFALLGAHDGAHIALHGGRDGKSLPTSSAWPSWFTEFTVADIAATVDALKQNGARIGAIEEQPFGKIAYLKDPEGNLLCLKQSIAGGKC